MSATGHVRIGQKAPYFQCEAVNKGVIEEVSLNTFIRPSTKPGTPDPTAPWLIILFIPAAFSFVCPTEVLAFQNCLDEFKDRNCNIVFVSVDTKHSLWHWQNVPRQYGGLGQIDIPLLSDANHRIAQDYGVLLEEEGVSLRGMFIIDNEGIVQQITLNNLTVGRSVLEALRLLEAFQAVAKHGVLCPIDWKPSGNAADTISTISNMLTESYDDRLANLQKEFGDVQVTDLDAKHLDEDSQDQRPDAPSESNSGTNAARVSNTEAGDYYERDSQSNTGPLVIQEVSCDRPKHSSPTGSNSDCLPHRTRSHSDSATCTLSGSASFNATPAPTPVSPNPPSLNRSPGTARYARGTRRRPLQLDQRALSGLFSYSSPSLFTALARRTSSFPTDSSSGHSSAPSSPMRLKPPTPMSMSMPTTPGVGLAGSSQAMLSDSGKAMHPSSVTTTPIPTPTSMPRLEPTLSRTNISIPAHTSFESRRGSHVTLEFADPTLSQPFPQHRIHSTPSLHSSSARPRANTRSSEPPRLRSHSSGPAFNSWAARESWSPESRLRISTNVGGAHSNPPSGGTTPDQTRLQATFEALKKMSGGLSSPRLDALRKARGEGYFDATVDAGEA